MQEFERRLRSGSTGVDKDTGLVTVGVNVAFADAYQDNSREDIVTAKGREVKNPRSQDLSDLVGSLGAEWDAQDVQEAASSGDFKKAWRSEIGGQNDKNMTVEAYHESLAASSAKSAETGSAA